MIRRLMHSLVVVALEVSALVTAPRDAARGQAGRSTAVILAVTDTLTSARARAILMRGGDGREDVIVLKRSNADAETLAGAFAMLARERRLRPAPRGLEVSTMQGVAIRGALLSDRVAALSSTLRKLAQQPTTRIGNLGPGQWVRLADPDSAR